MDVALYDFSGLDAVDRREQMEFIAAMMGAYASVKSFLRAVVEALTHCVMLARSPIQSSFTSGIEVLGATRPLPHCKLAAVSELLMKAVAVPSGGGKRLQWHMILTLLIGL